MYEGEKLKILNKNPDKNKMINVFKYKDQAKNIFKYISFCNKF